MIAKAKPRLVKELAVVGLDWDDAVRVLQLLDSYDELVEAVRDRSAFLALFEQLAEKDTPAARHKIIAKSKRRQERPLSQIRQPTFPVLQVGKAPFHMSHPSLACSPPSFPVGSVRS